VIRLYHGGVPGLRIGDHIRPGHSRDDRHPGCAICEARAAGAPTPIDPASVRQDRVYVTEDREYARYHASLYGRGDLYQVATVGDVERSGEDEFPSYVCERAEVVAVYARAVILTWQQRRSLYRRWSALEGMHPRDADREFERMVDGLLAGRERP